MLSVVYAECPKKPFAGCHFAECCYADCFYAECRSAQEDTLNGASERCFTWVGSWPYP
jgi:hypothetical protein